MSVVPDSIRDSTTIRNDHTINTYMGCVLLRISLGLVLVLLPAKVFSIKEWVSVFALLIAAGFASKWFRTPGQTTWKVFIRTTLIYLCVALLLFMEPNPVGGDLVLIRIAGALMIVDAAMGLQSRHTVQVIRRLTEGI
jgi:hypothetical protein